MNSELLSELMNWF